MSTLTLATPTPTSDMTDPALTADYGLYVPSWPRTVPSLLKMATEYVRNNDMFNIATANVPQELREAVQAKEATAKMLADAANSIIENNTVDAFEALVAIYSRDASKSHDWVRFRLTLKVLEYLGRRGHVAAIETMMTDVASYIGVFGSVYASQLLYGLAQGQHKDVFESMCRQYQVSEWGSDEALGQADWSEYFWQRHPQPTSDNLAAYVDGLMRQGHADSAAKWIQEHHSHMAQYMTSTAYYCVRAGMYTVADACMEHMERPFEIFMDMLPRSRHYPACDLSMDELVQYVLYLRSKLVQVMSSASVDKQLACRRLWLTILQSISHANAVVHARLNDHEKGAFGQYMAAAVSVWQNDDTMADILTKPCFNMTDVRTAAAQLV